MQDLDLVAEKLPRNSAALTLLACAFIALIWGSGTVGLYYCTTLDVPPEQEAQIRPQLDELASISYGCWAASAVCAGLWMLVRRWKKSCPYTSRRR